VMKDGRGGPRARFVYAHLLAATGRSADARIYLASALESGSRSDFDTPGLKDARLRIVSLADPEFCKFVDRLERGGLAE
jgi:hypothetical protein